MKTSMVVVECGVSLFTVVVLGLGRMVIVSSILHINVGNIGDITCGEVSWISNSLLCRFVCNVIEFVDLGTKDVVVV